MNAEKLLIHDRCERKRAEGVHASLVETIRIFPLAYMRRNLGERAASTLNMRAPTHIRA